MLFLRLAASAYIYVDAYSDCDLFVVLSIIIIFSIRARYSVKSNEVLILYSNLLMPRHD